MQANKKLNLGILGASRIANKVCSYLNQQNPILNLHAIASRDPAKANDFNRKYNFNKCYTNYDSLLLDPKVDLVYITLPNSLHFQFCKQALEAKKHVLCEKPLVTSVNEARLLQNMALKNSNLKIMEAFWYRFHPLLLDLKKIIANKVIGDIQGFYSTFCYLNSQENDIRWKKNLGGGALFDMFCYHVDTLNFLFGTDLLKSINELEAFARYRNGVDASVCVDLLAPNNFQAILISSIEKNSINRTTIVGSEGSLIIPNIRIFPQNGISNFTLTSANIISNMVNNLGKPSSQKKYVYPATNAYVEMIKNFVDSIKNDTQPALTLEESLANIELLTKIKNSFTTKRSNQKNLLTKIRLIQPLIKVIKKGIRIAKGIESQN